MAGRGGKRKNLDGISLGESILKNFTQDLTSTSLLEDHTGKIYSAYRDDPAGFGIDILGETFTDDMITVMESVRDNQITIARSANGTGKTHGAARVAAWFYKCFDGAQVYTAAAGSEDNLKRILWGQIGALTENHPQIFDGDRVKASSLKIYRSANEFMVGVPIPITGTDAQREARFSGKHAPAILFVIDEGDAVPPEVYKGIESCMSGGHARLLILFNPRAQVGPTYRMEVQKEAHVVELSAFTHPNVITGKEIYPGAVTRDSVVTRIANWTRSMYQGEKRDDSCFEIPKFLVGCRPKAPQGEVKPPLIHEWRKIIEPEFSYMVLGRYPEMSENQLINRSWIDAAIDRWKEHNRVFGREMPPTGILPTMGLDVADMGSDLNVCFMRYDWYVPSPFCWSGVDPSVSAEEAGKIYKQTNCIGAWVDSTGVGAAVPGLLIKSGCRAHRIMMASSPTVAIEEGEFGRVRDQGWWFLREWFRTNPMAMIPDDEQLREELLAMHYYKNEQGRIKVTPKDTLREKLRRSPDKGDALMLTFCPVPEDTVYEMNVTRYI